jgi:hypothetical protein
MHEMRLDKARNLAQCLFLIKQILPLIYHHPNEKIHVVLRTGMYNPIYCNG